MFCYISVVTVGTLSIPVYSLVGAAIIAKVLVQLLCIKLHQSTSDTAAHSCNILPARFLRFTADVEERYCTEEP